MGNDWCIGYYYRVNKAVQVVHHVSIFVPKLFSPVGL